MRTVGPTLIFPTVVSVVFKTRLGFLFPDIVTLPVLSSDLTPWGFSRLPKTI